MKRTLGPLSILMVLSFASASAFGATPQDSSALPFVSPIFGDNMVLQRGKANVIWGWSKPGDKVQVEIGDNSATAIAANDGRWQVRIQPPPVGGPYTVKIAGAQTAELHNVLVGDVWICAGQSNMQFGLAQARNGAEEVKNADHPQIRYFVVGQRSAYSHVDTPRGTWRVVSPTTVGGRGGGISAAAYFFARRVQESIHVPIGLVQAAVGGVPAETFTSPEALRPLKDFDAGLAEVERRRQKGGPEYGNFIMHWYDEYDTGSKNGSWADPALDDPSWKSVRIPGGFKELGVGETPSLSWFRKEITLPATLPQGMARIYLGSIEKMDTTYVNGRQVGASAWVENPRVYFVPEGVLKPGRNVIAIRVLKIKPDGGFLAQPDELHLTLGDGSVIPLSGEWKGKVSVDARPPHPLPMAFENWPVMPSVLYQGMLAPVAPLAMTGAIWYQGEANSERAYQYRKLLPAMIADWRKLFGQGDFPFYIAGLPFFKHRRDEPGDDSWAELREAQALTVQKVPHSCLAVTIDTGDADNIHPVDKKEVGDRLAFCALGEHYGVKIPRSGPTLASVERLPSALKLHFDHADGGLVVKGEKLGEFSVAGDDRKWQWADARIEGDAVIVSSKSVPDPKQVRYAWQANPVATLFNGVGLPAVPFRTDNWPGITEGQAPQSSKQSSNQSSNSDQKLDPATLVDAPVVPQMVVDSDGTLHFGPRTVPLPALSSPEARQAYTRMMLQRAQVSASRGGLASVRVGESNPATESSRSKETALKIYQVVEESQKIGGVGVTIYSPKTIPPKNRNKVLMEFEMDAEAIAVASLGQLKVIKVNYRGGGPSIPGNEDIVAVYRELLKTYKPKSIGMFGASGGCTLAQTTILWLPEQKLPLPGAVGLGTCSGGSNPGDARYTLNGLDAALSTAFSGRPPFGGRNATPRKPGEPPATALDGDIPKGFPPAFLLAGTRDMCLSQTVLLHRKLRNAGIEADLNIFEGMWHFFWENPELPESREAMTALAGFFNRHLE